MMDDSDAVILIRALARIIHQRDHHAEDGKEAFEMGTDQCFDDWAADEAEDALRKATGLMRMLDVERYMDRLGLPRVCNHGPNSHAAVVYGCACVTCLDGIHTIRSVRYRQQSPEGWQTLHVMTGKVYRGSNTRANNAALRTAYRLLESVTDLCEVEVIFE